MAQKDSGDGPSLELPSLGFGRKRRQRGAPSPESSPETSPGSAPASSEPVEPAPVDPPAPFTPEPPLPSAHEAEAPTRTEVLTETPAAAAPQSEPRARRRLPRPRLSGPAAAAVTGLVAGLLLVALVWLSTRGCDVVAGTSSCGNPGVLLLLGVLVAVVVAGRVMLGWLGAQDPGSTSFLAVGLVAVASLLFLTSVMFESWAAVVVVALSVGAFVLAHWVTTAFVDPGGSDHHR